MSNALSSADFDHAEFGSLALAQPSLLDLLGRVEPEVGMPCALVANLANTEWPETRSLDRRWTPFRHWRLSPSGIHAVTNGRTTPYAIWRFAGTRPAPGLQPGQIQL